MQQTMSKSVKDSFHRSENSNLLSNLSLSLHVSILMERWRIRKVFEERAKRIDRHESSRVAMGYSWE